VTPTRNTICPFTLMDVVPLDPEAWLKAVVSSTGFGVGELVSQAIGSLRIGMRTTGRVVTSPVSNLVWGVEIATKLAGLLACYTEREIATGTMFGERMMEAVAAPP